METHYPAVNVPATPEYVLSVMIDRQRREWLDDSLSVPDDIAPLTFDSTIDDLIEACGFWDWYDIVFEIHAWFEMDCDYQEWKDLLMHSDLRTVGDLCDLIAAYATIPTIQLSTFCGRTCRPASAFLTIRSILHDAGVDTTSIGPSTLLHEFTRKHQETFLGPISHLAPTGLPKIYVKKYFWNFNSIESLTVFLYIILNCAAGTGSPPVLLAYIGFLCMLSWLLTWITLPRVPMSVQFGNLKTFRDLSELIAKHASVSPA